MSGGTPIGYLGATPSQVEARNMELALANGANEKMDFVPADPDPNRMYWCRQPDNTYLLLNRRTIDQMGCIWYVRGDGSMYAVKKA